MDEEDYCPGQQYMQNGFEWHDRSQAELELAV